MDKANYLRKIQISNTEQLLKYYRETDIRVRQKLDSAIERGNDTYHLRAVRTSIQKEIVRLDSLYKKFSTKTIPETFNISDELIKEEIKKFNSSNNLPIATFAKIPKETIQILSDNAYKSLSQVPVAIGRQSEDFLRRVALQSTSDIITGSKSIQEVRRDLTRELRDNNFFHITYSNGARVNARSYSGMVARTTSAEAFRAGTTERLNRTGYDLVEILGHTRDPDSPCRPFEGRTLSLNGSSEGFMSIESAKAQGLFHANCVHDLGLSKKNLDYL